MKRSTSTDEETRQASERCSPRRPDEASVTAQIGVVEVELIGSLQRVVGAKQVTLPLTSGTTVLHVLEDLEREHGVRLPAGPSPSMKGGLYSLLVLVNGREISVLDGVQTLVDPGAKIVLIPVTHGG